MDPLGLLLVVTNHPKSPCWLHGLRISDAIGYSFPRRKRRTRRLWFTPGRAHVPQVLHFSSDINVFVSSLKQDIYSFHISCPMYLSITYVFFSCVFNFRIFFHAFSICFFPCVFRFHPEFPIDQLPSPRGRPTARHEASWWNHRAIGNG